MLGKPAPFNSVASSWSIQNCSTLVDLRLQHRMSALGPGCVKTQLVLFVGGVSRDPGGIVRLGAANSAELVRANAYWLLEAKNAGLLRPVRPVSCVDCLHQSANA